MAIRFNNTLQAISLSAERQTIRVGGSLFLNNTLPRPDYRIELRVSWVDLSLNVLGEVILVGVPRVQDTFVHSSVTYYYVDFDVTRYFKDNAPNPNFCLPANDQSKQIDYSRFYILNAREFYDGTFTAWTAGSTTQAMPVGRPVVRNYTTLTNAQLITDFFNQATNQNFLTLWRTPNRWLNVHTPIWLYFHVNARQTQKLKLEVSINYKWLTDDVSGSTLLDIIPNNSNGKTFGYCFRLANLDWSSLNLSNPFNPAGVLSFSARISDEADDSASEIITFTPINNLQYPNVRTFLYVNSLGAPDMFVTVGKRQTKNMLQYMEADLNFNNDTTATDRVVKGSLAQYNQKILTEQEQPTGWQSANGGFNHFLDFMRSKVKYEFVNGYLYPIIIKDTDLGGANDESTLFARKFTYVYAHAEEFWQ